MSESLNLETLSSVPSGCGEYRDIPIASIHVGPRLRKLRPDKVLALTESIKTVGLHNPISVTEEPVGEDGDQRFELVFGNHRRQACADLGWPTIPARVLDLNSITRQLVEIDENLCRAELTALERAEHLFRRKELYEELHPETRQHVAGAVAANAARAKSDATDKLSVASFAADTADKTGFTDRTIRREISRAKKIDQAVRDLIRDDLKIADSGSELDALAKMKLEDQSHAVHLVQTGKCKSIREARRALGHYQLRQRPPAKNPNKRKQVHLEAADLTANEQEDAEERAPDEAFTWEAGARQLIPLLLEAMLRNIEPVPNEQRIIDLLIYCKYPETAAELEARRSSRAHASLIVATTSPPAADACSLSTSQPASGQLATQPA